jgi:peptidyl-prolyl cis-trans isomerase D
VGDRVITAADFTRVYNMQMQAYRNAYGGSMNTQMLKQLGIDRQILQQLIDEEVSAVEAARLGITANDAEVRERILRIPAFQENGQFVGEERYKQVLRMQRPPLTHNEFEDNVRKSIVLEKLRMAVTDWITVADAEIDQEFRKRNEKVKLQLVSIPAAKFREGLTATDEELARHFEANKEAFRIGETRKIKYALVDVQKLREKVAVSPQDVSRSYNQNIDQYTTPEQVRASHILLKTEGKDEAAVRAQAATVLAEARKPGADFAALATKYSEDEGSKSQGGDLNFFGRGRMVPEFDQAAFAMEPGTISDLVKTPFGFHVIKVTEKRPGGTRTLEEVTPQITEQIKWERAQTQAADLAAKVATEARSAADLQTVAAKHGLTVQDSDFFQRDEPITGVGPAADISAQAFTLKDGELGEPARTPQGHVVFAVIGRQDSRIPTLDEAKDKVRAAVIDEKALAAAKAKAAELALVLRAAADFEAAAKAAGFEAKATELVPRGSSLPDVGISPAVENAVFAQPAGAVADGMATKDAAVIAKVVERATVTPQEVTAGRDGLRTELLNERRARFFASYMTKAKEKLKISIDRTMLQRLVA